MTSQAAADRPNAVTTGRWRSRFFTGALIAPAALWYVVLLVSPIVLVIVFSFGTRNRTGGYTPGFTFENYAAAIKSPDPFLTSSTFGIARFGRIGRSDGFPAVSPLAETPRQVQLSVHVSF